MTALKNLVDNYNEYQSELESKERLLQESSTC